MAIKNHTLVLRVPFPSKQSAEIALRTLDVDSPPPRSTVTTDVHVDNNDLVANFSAQISDEPRCDAISQLKKLRISIGSWMSSLQLACETLAEFGDPPVDSPLPNRAISGKIGV